MTNPLARPPLAKSIWLIVFLVLVSLGSGFGQQPTSGGSVPPQQVAPSPTPQDVNATILQYQAALRAEDETHRKFLEGEMDLLKWVIGLTVPIVGAIFLLLNWTSRQEIRTQVKKRFDSSVGAEIEQRLEEFNKFLSENRKKIGENREKIAEIDRLLELVSDLTYAFHVLSVRLDDPEWDAARRDAQKQLEVWRRRLPSSRRLGILLGRLQKYFGDYDAAAGILTEVMRERDAAQMPQDIDYAALLYNRACYRTLNAAKVEPDNPGQARSLRAQAWKDLNRSVELDPESKAEAQADPDVQTLWKDWPKEKLGSKEA